MRTSIVKLAKHVPLIKFPNRKETVEVVTGPHFFSNGVMPSALTGTTASKPNTVTLRSELPERFRYRPIEEIEIEDVNFGGSEVLIH